MVDKSQAFPHAGVIGWPISHSLSPSLHTWWLNEYGINGDFEAFAIEPDNLPAFLEGMRDGHLVGANVTVPHKQAVMAGLDSLTQQARHIGAVNVITVDEGGKLHGSNTDGFGFLENLTAGHSDFDAATGPVAVLGAGGAARAVVSALIDAGAPEIRLLNRTRAKSDTVAADLGGGKSNVQAIDWDGRDAALDGAALLVNTTSLGMTGQAPLQISLDALPTNAVVNDIVYAPLETNLLARAHKRGNVTVDGLGMLLHQARPAFEAFFGVAPKVTDALRQHVLAAVEGKE